jgi:hypothetical protein
MFFSRDSSMIMAILYIHYIGLLVFSLTVCLDHEFVGVLPRSRRLQFLPIQKLSAFNAASHSPLSTLFMRAHALLCPMRARRPRLSSSSRRVRNPEELVVDCVSCRWPVRWIDGEASVIARFFLDQAVAEPFPHLDGMHELAVFSSGKGI